MERLRPQWEWIFGEALRNSSAPPTVFQSFAWNLIAAKIFRHQAPCVVLAQNSGAAVLIPAAIHEGGCLTLLGEALADYRDCLAGGDYDAIAEALAAAWSPLAELCLPFSVPAVRADSCLYIRADQRDGLSPQPFVGAPRACRHQISAAGFAARHHRLAKRLRHFQRAGAKLACRNGSDADLLRSLYRHKAEQFAESGNNLFADSKRIEFMVAACAQPEMGCEIFGFEVSGDLMAALVTFRESHARRIYTTWFDPRWGHYSPGALLLYEVTRLTLAEGLDADFLTGEQPHKTRLATSSVPLFRIDAPAESIARLANTLRREPAAA